MKHFLKLSLIVITLLFSSTLKSQVLISLLFGDKLNTPNIEFGLIGGLNRTYFAGYNNSKGLNNFDLGFYFHILLKKNSYISTGVLVKANSGAQDMPVYATGNADIDSAFVNGSLTTKVNYFYVPILFQQRFLGQWYVELGGQVGLRAKAYDTFTTSIDGSDLDYTIDVRDQYRHLDAGLMGGLGFKTNKKIKSFAVGVNYYYGLVNISLAENTKIKNSALYVYAKVPIGVKKAERAAAEKAKTSGQ